MVHPPCSSRSTWALVPALALAALAPLPAQAPAAGSSPDAPLRRPAGHEDRGLPDPAAVWTPYDADPQHVLNRIFRAAFLVHVVPAEVGAALPREHGRDPDFFAPGWYFARRKGTAADARWFGGDGRQLPVEGFDAAAAAALQRDLAAVAGDVAAALRVQPRLCVCFQNDLLRLARRLLDAGNDAELLAPLLAAARAVALPARALEAPSLATFSPPDLDALAPGGSGAWVEVQRRSTRLFDAEYSLHWSSVFVRFPAGSEPDARGYLDALAAGKPVPPLPLHAVAVLVQGLCALDDGGKPRATGLVDDVRVQRLANRAELAAGNPTTTRDGVDFRLWHLPRQSVRTAGGGALPLAAFREVPVEDQDLFRDYGTSKHTTVAAQCALCHRRSHGPDESLAGFLALRAANQPRAVVDAGERRRQAETEFGRFLASLAAAAR